MFWFILNPERHTLKVVCRVILLNNNSEHTNLLTGPAAVTKNFWKEGHFSSLFYATAHRGDEVMAAGA